MVLSERWRVSDEELCRQIELIRSGSTPQPGPRPAQGFRKRCPQLGLPLERSAAIETTSKGPQRRKAWGKSQGAIVPSQMDRTEQIPNPLSGVTLMHKDIRIYVSLPAIQATLCLEVDPDLPIGPDDVRFATLTQEWNDAVNELGCAPLPADQWFCGPSRTPDPSGTPRQSPRPASQASRAPSRAVSAAGRPCSQPDMSHTTSLSARTRPGSDLRPMARTAPLLPLRDRRSASASSAESSGNSDVDASPRPDSSPRAHMRGRFSSRHSHGVSSSSVAASQSQPRAVRTPTARKQLADLPTPDWSQPSMAAAPPVTPGAARKSIIPFAEATGGEECSPRALRTTSRRTKRESTATSLRGAVSEGGDRLGTQDWPSRPRAQAFTSLQEALEDVTGMPVEDQHLRLGARRVDQNAPSQDGSWNHRGRTLRQSSVFHGSTLILNVGASEIFDTKVVEDNLRLRAQGNRSGLNIWIMPRWQSPTKPRLVSGARARAPELTNQQVYLPSSGLCGDPCYDIRKRF